MLVTATTYLICFLFVFVPGVFWSNDDAAPSVRVLGSGSRLSLLITSGNARLLIASGDDASAFGNALSRARHPTSRRLDVIVLAGDERDLPVASRVARDFPDSAIFVLDGPLASHLDDLGLRQEQVIVEMTSFHLSGGVDVAIGPGFIEPGSWSTTIQHGSSTIVAGSDVEAVKRSGGRASVLIVTNQFDSEVLPALYERALVLPTRSTTISDLRDALAEMAVDRIWAIRVQPAQAVRLTFTRGGVELPPSARLLESGQSDAATSSWRSPGGKQAPYRTPA